MQEYFKNLLMILDNQLEALCLDLVFAEETHEFGQIKLADLKPNGRNIAVTDENKFEYVKLVAQHRMTSSIKAQLHAFLEGFHDLIPRDLVSIFDEKELELLISGMPEIDFTDLKANTDYNNFKLSDPQIRWFWEALESFTQEEKAKFVQFVTGTSKVPVEGFKALQGMRGLQKFNIHKAYGGETQLPASHTCFNQLDLPEYTSKEQTLQRLLYAINEGSEGFGFN